MNELNDFINDYLEYCKCRKRLSEKTTKAYRIDLTQYLKAIPADAAFRAECVDDYITLLHSRYAPKSIKRKIASLKAFFKHLEYRGLLEANPFHKIDVRFREPKPLPKTVPFHVIQTFLANLHQQKGLATSPFQASCRLRDIAVIELLFATGIRISELCALKSSDVNLDSQVILVYGKGAKERLIQIGNPEVVSALARYKDAFTSEIVSVGFFFVNRLKNRLSEQSVRFMICKYTRLFGIDMHITPHMFRHSFATLLLEQDVDIRYIQKILGHSSIVTTEIYTHVSSAKQKDILVNKHPRNLMSVNGG